MSIESSNDYTTTMPTDEVTIVAIGPLTNIAIAMKSHPNLASKIKELFIMGGNMEGIGNATITAEFNFYADPEAASVVLDNTRCPTHVVTCELCNNYVNLSMVRTLNNLHCSTVRTFLYLDMAQGDPWRS